MVRLSDLKPPRRNARTHSDKQILQLADSIQRFGWSCPIVTDENRRIIAGVGRWKAAEHLGLREVPVTIMLGLSQAEKRALALADNKVASNAGWDRAVLAVELGELADLLPEFNLNLSITGFDPIEIERLVRHSVDRKADPADKIAPPSVSRRGDLWQLGQHRLLCGDVRAGADLRQLMGREGAALIITHPPYNDLASPIEKHRKFNERQAISRKLSSQRSIQSLIDAFSLAAKLLRHCSRRDGIVLDPFAGSGTTILAAERAGRRGYGLERDPLCVDAAIRRWQEFTKRDAVLARTNQTFDEVAVARAITKRGKRH